MSLRSRTTQLLERMARVRLCYLLIAAGILHLLLCVLIVLVGRLSVIPGLFDADGISGALALDSSWYRLNSIDLVTSLSRGNIVKWFNEPFPLHVKIYSLSFAALRPLFGFTVLSVEPLNLLYYLSILLLVFKLCEELFDRRAAALAAIAVALWPSFLLHTTQLLRDPLFILVMLILVIVCTRWLTKSHTLHRGLMEALAGGAASAVVWLTRYNMWKLLISMVALAAALLIARQLRERRWLFGNLAGTALLLVILSAVPVVIGFFLPPDLVLSESPIFATQPPTTPSPCPDEPPVKTITTAEPSSIWSRLLARADSIALRVDEIRHSFARGYADAGSNIDPCAKLNNAADLLRYLPRAAAHGFFLPYPNMWLDTGKAVGRPGRLLSGLEMLFVYLIELMAIVGFWSGRRNLAVWLLTIVALTGIVALGLAIINAGALFRMRYVFLMLLIVLGSGGAIRTLSSEQRSAGREA